MCRCPDFFPSNHPTASCVGLYDLFVRVVCGENTLKEYFIEPVACYSVLSLAGKISDLHTTRAYLLNDDVISDIHACVSPSLAPLGAI